MPTRKIICMGDTHCGHVAGLTPPSWEAKGTRGLAGKLAPLRSECWKWFEKTVKKLGPFDGCIFNGDGIDGDGGRSGGTELLTVDRGEQAAMAAECLGVVGAPRIWQTYGTAYHTGQVEDFEDYIQEFVPDAKVTIGSHEWPEVNGLIFDVKHHLGSSSVPHGRHTASSRDHTWNIMWNEIGQQPKAHVFLRSHVHYHQYCGGPGWLAMTLPPLQAAATKYGARRCSGTVDFGFVVFEIDNKGAYSWQPHILRPVNQRARTSKL